MLEGMLSCIIDSLRRWFGVSRLYGIMKSDMAKTEATRRADEEIEVAILWGDKWNPKVAVEVKVVWEKGEEKPMVRVFYGDVRR